MNFKQIDNSPKTFILVFKTGDELAKGLSAFAEEQKLSAASFARMLPKHTGMQPTQG